MTYFGNVWLVHEAGWDTEQLLGRIRLTWRLRPTPGAARSCWRSKSAGLAGGLTGDKHMAEAGLQTLKLDFLRTCRCFTLLSETW